MNHDLAFQVVRLAESAGDAVIAEYERMRGGIAPDVARKADESPCTRADIASHEILTAGLSALEPRYPILSEESASIPFAERANWERYWLVDPLDGTREFLNAHGDFTVNVALVERGTPILGVVHVPVSGATYWAERGRGAWLREERGDAFRPIHVADYRDASAPKVLVSRSHAGAETEAFLARIGACEREAVGSSLKMCRVADGSAHLYPRFGTTMEWDVAAAYLIVCEAGGSFTDVAGNALRFNKPDLRNPNFVVAGAPPFPWRNYV
jgi:3'(2'), 5'-bisphosphate nucleotidase